MDEQAARLAADERVSLEARPTRRKARRTTNPNHSLPIAPNLLERQFNPTAPNVAWVTDITYIPTKDGWIYLVAILDLYSRMVVSFETSTSLTADFCRQALRHAMAIRNRPKVLIVHSERGVQFAAEAFRSVIDEREALLSMRRKGECHDNAVVERFWSSLKAESIEKTALGSQAQARTTVKRYVDDFYHPIRLHSYLDWLSPMAFERRARLNGVIG